MKRNFLLMLLLTLLPFVGWAAVVSDGLAGGYTVTISEQYLALTNAEAGVDAPAITKVEQVTTGTTTWEGAALTDAGVYVKKGTAFQKVETTIKAEGIYYKGAYITVGDPAVKKLILVPFYVGVPSSRYDFISDNESWTASYMATAPALGGLKNYYEANTDEDRYNFEENRWAWASDKANNGGVWPGWCRQDWLGAINAPLAAYPWIVPYLKDVEGAYVLVFKYPGYNDFMPWGTTTFGTTGDRVRGCASIPEELGFQDPVKYPAKANAQGELTDETTGKIKTVANTTYGNDNALPFLINVNKETGVVTPDPDGFDIEEFNMLLVPASLVLNTVDVVDVKSIATATIAPSPINLPYTGAVQKPVFTSVPATPTSEAVAANAFVKDGATTLVEGVDYEIEWAAGADYTNFGNKPFRVIGIGLYDGTLDGSYNIVKGRIAINLANIHKTYGDPDPALPENATAEQIAAYAAQLNFSIDAATPLQGEDVKSDIAKYLVVKRVSGADNQGENVREYDYWYDYSADYATESNYDIIFLQNSSKLVIDKAPLTLHVTNYWKMYHQPNPASFPEYTVVNANQLKNGDQLADVQATITRKPIGTENGKAIYDEGVNAHLTTVEGVTYAVLNSGNEAYNFQGTAANYEITFDNGFMIIPSDNIAGVTVTVKNTTTNKVALLNSSKYVYTSYAIEPGKGALANDLVVTDGEYTLTTDDYEIASSNNYSGYDNNIHVGAEGAAVVKIKLKGSSYSNHGQKQGTFTIVKAPLTLRAKSKTDYAPGDEIELAIDYANAGFLGKDWYQTVGVGTTHVKAKGFVEPTITQTAISGSSKTFNLVVTGGSADDYEITRVNGTASYGESVFVVVADNAQKTFGSADPEKYTEKIYKLTGENRVLAEVGVNMSEAQYAALNSNTGGTPVYSLSRQTGEDVGEYPIYVNGPTVLPEGIIVRYEEGIFTINHKVVKLVTQNAEKFYGDPNSMNPPFTARVKAGDLVDPDTETSLGITNQNFYYVQVEGVNLVNIGTIWNPNLTWDTERLDAKDYNIIAHIYGQHSTTPNPTTGAERGIIGNYIVEVDNAGKFTVKKAPITIKADDKTQVYRKETEKNLTATVTGMKLNQTLAKDRDYTLTRANKASNNADWAHVGDYTITVNTVNNSVNTGVLKNYQVTPTNGTYSVTAAALEVTANDQAIYYGETHDPYDMVVKIKGTETALTKDEFKDWLRLTTTFETVGPHENAYTIVKGNATGSTDYSLATEDFHNGWLTIAPLRVIPLEEADLAQVIPGKSLKQVLEDHKGMKVNVSLPARKMDADEWYAWVLPFDVTPGMFSVALSDAEHDFFGYAAMETLDKNKSKGKSVVFNLEMFKVDANTPFILKVNKDLTGNDTKAIVFRNVIIGNLDYLTTKPATVATGVSFVGQYESTTGFNENQMYLAKVTPKDAPAGYVAHREFWKGGENSANIPFVATNACLDFTVAVTEGEVHIYIQEEDGSYTAISGVEAEATVDTEATYNLAGQRVNKAQRGIYIKDGKKVLVK